MKRVLITGARAPVALDLARAIRAAGHHVTLADSVHPFAAALSRPRLPIQILQPPRFAFAAFRKCLREIVSDFDVVVPTCEEVFWLAGAAEVDGWSDRLFAPKLETLRHLHSKALFPELARAGGIDAPRTRPLTDADALTELSDTTSLVFKPEYSRFGSCTLIAPSRSTLDRIRPTASRQWVAQERIAGEEFCVWSVMSGARLTACVVYRPLLRHNRSASYAFEAVDRPDIVAMAAAIAARVGGSGQLSYDVIVTPQGRVAPLECNPRTISGIHLYDASPAVAQALLDGREISPPLPGTIRYLAPAMLMMGLPATIGGSSFTEWRRIWRSGEDAVGRPGDRAPGVGVLLDAARFALLGVARQRSPSGESTDDIEWNGEAIG